VPFGFPAELTYTLVIIAAAALNFQREWFLILAVCVTVVFMSLPWDYIAKLVCIGDSGTGKSSVSLILSPVGLMRMKVIHTENAGQQSC
jgi:Na+/glutamate symporter